MADMLEKKGYRISLSGWMGRLGNHLVQLSGAINVARMTQSELTVPRHPLLRRTTYDFTQPLNDNCREPVDGLFFFKSQCFQFPIEYDRVRRDILQEYVLGVLERRSVRERIQHFLEPRRGERVAPNTLVINMRSGKDIFRTDPPPQNDYMQPPLSFYKHIIETHGYDDCLIVTEAERANPCIAALVSWNPSIRIKTHASVKSDIRAILEARHLVLCHSSFSWCLALMSRNLRVLHQPETFTIRGVNDLLINTYAFDEYITPGEWKATRDQLAAMLDHSQDDVRPVAGRDAGSGQPDRLEISRMG